MKIVTIYLYLALVFYCVVGHRLMEEDEIKRRASGTLSTSFKQTLEFKTKQQTKHILSKKKGSTRVDATVEGGDNVESSSEQESKVNGGDAVEEKDHVNRDDVVEGKDYVNKDDAQIKMYQVEKTKQIFQKQTWVRSNSGTWVKEKSLRYAVT